MAKKQSALGKDFYSILDDNIMGMKDGGAATTLRISEIEPRSDQPRKQFDREALEALADSIATYGVLQPILVRPNPNFEGNYEIIAVDFDGTLCFSKWPDCGEPNLPLINYLKKSKSDGNKLILWT